MLNGPGEAIRSGANINMAGHFQLLEINNGYIIIRRAADKRARSILIHLNACTTLTETQPLYFFPRCYIVDKEISSSQGGNQCQLAIGRKLEAISTHCFR